MDAEAPIRQLRLDHTETADADLAEIAAKNPELRELTLGSTKIGDLDESLTKLGKLKKIRVSNSAISAKALEILAKMESLEDIDLSQSAVDDIGRLARLPKLKRLNLYSTKVKDVSLDSLKNFRSAETLVWLNLDRCSVTDAAISKLEPLKNLEWLHLGRTALTDVGLEGLARLTSLKEVSITNTQVTSAGVENLRSALPNCVIKAQTAYNDDAETMKQE